MSGSTRQWHISIGLVVLLFTAASPAAAQRRVEPLFDRFSLRLEGSLVGMSTQLGLTPDGGGVSPVLNFEDDLDLDGSEVIPTVDVDWQDLESEAGDVRYTGVVVMDIGDASVFVRGRF